MWRLLSCSGRIKRKPAQQGDGIGMFFFVFEAPVLTTYIAPYCSLDHPPDFARTGSRPYQTTDACWKNRAPHLMVETPLGSSGVYRTAAVLPQVLRTYIYIHTGLCTLTDGIDTDDALRFTVRRSKLDLVLVSRVCTYLRLPDDTVCLRTEVLWAACSLARRLELDLLNRCEHRIRGYRAVSVLWNQKQ